MKSSRIPVRVKALQWECDDVLKIVLIPLNDKLPSPEPGAHIDVCIPDAPVRQYSLTASSTSEEYVLGVRRDPKTRGGSEAVHRRLRPGDVIEISAPRNAFPLVDDGPVHLIAGGIGITPILYMAERLARSGRRWSLSYYSRSESHTAFLKEVEELGGKVHFDDVDGAPNLKAEVDEQTENTHLYCCGPAPMLDAFVEACSDREEHYVHIERFSSAPVPVGAGEFVVELRKSGQEFTVAADKSILDTLIEAGLKPAHNCCAGICGECELKVIEGKADHKDMILSDAEKEAGSILICCSRAQSDRLVFDI